MWSQICSAIRDLSFVICHSEAGASDESILRKGVDGFVWKEPNEGASYEVPGTLANTVHKIDASEPFEDEDNDEDEND